MAPEQQLPVAFCAPGLVTQRLPRTDADGVTQPQNRAQLALGRHQGYAIDPHAVVAMLSHEATVEGRQEPGLMLAWNQTASNIGLSLRSHCLGLYRARDGVQAQS